MRHLSLILARLYPRPWRERYGEEFGALIEEAEAGPRTAWNVLTGAISMHIKTWRYGWVFAVAAACACAAFAATVMLVPNPYISEGILRIRTTEARDDTADAVNTFVQRAESRSALTNIITAENLYTHERERKEFEEVLQQMQRSITVTPLRTPDGLLAIRVDFD